MSKDNERIQHLKHYISKLPRKTPNTDLREFEHFNSFFSTFHNSLKISSFNEDLVLRFSYHLEQLWQHILSEFMQPYWFTTNRGVSMELMSKYKGGRMDTQILKILIQKAIDDNELPDFFVAFPYVKDLLIIDRYLSHPLPNEPEVLGEVMRITAEYIDTLKHYDNIFPLLVLREHVHLMLDSDQFDQGFYVKYMKGAEVCLRDKGQNTNTNLMFLSLFISEDIPYAIRKVEGFKQFNWDAFDGLYRNLGAVDKVELPTILLGLERYIDELISFKLGELGGENLHAVDVTAIELINVEANVNPAFAIIDDYLGIITSIREDSTTARLAILRAITAIGEAINSIKLLVPEGRSATLEIIINLRDHIVHSSTYDASRYINDLIYNLDNKTLINVLAEIRELQPFINELKGWITSPRAIDSFPLIPDMQIIREFENAYTIARTKDDRSEKLSLADYKILQGLIPVVEEIDNPNYAIIEAFIRQGIQLDRNSFVDACTGCYNNQELRKTHDKIKEINKIYGIKQFSQKVDFDFARITLNLSKSDKKRLEEIKERKNLTELQQLLDEYMQKLLKDFNADKFLYNVKKINLTPYKQILKDFIEGKMPPKEEFDKAVKIVFNDHIEGIQLWHDAYTKFMGHIESIKRDQINQIQYSIANINLLKEEADKIFDGQNIDIRINSIIAIACEMLYGFCSDSFKGINKFINLLHDYTDQTLYYSFIREHPIQEVSNTLDIAIQIRHQIFHFERAFQGDNIALCRELWFSMIQNMTHGMFFPEAIVLSPEGVSKQEMFGESSLQKLAKFMKALKQDLGRDPNTLNIYMIMLAQISNGTAFHQESEEKSDASLASAEQELVESVITVSTIDEPQLGGLGMVADAQLDLNITHLTQEQIQRELAGILQSEGAEENH